MASKPVKKKPIKKSSTKLKSPKSPKSPKSTNEDMTFTQLGQKFHDYAIELGQMKDSSSRFRSSSYERAAGKFDAVGSELATDEKINALELTDYMKTKAIKVLNGSQIGRLKKSSTRKKSPVKKSAPIESKPNPKLIKELTEFMGLGPEKAKQLIEAGVRNINQLHMKKYIAMLPEETKLFMQLKPEQKIPHAHIEMLEHDILELANDEMKITIVGSYRRNKPFSSDIDVMLVSEDESVTTKFLEQLSNITKVYPYSKGRDKISMIVDMTEMVKSKTPIIYKIDAFRTTPEDEIPMLLYSTGSKEFNIEMRRKAKKLGFLLNQKGLFQDGEKVPDLTDEKDYFDILEMDYKEPEERI
jgi:DNA polymerase (family 10)